MRMFDLVADTRRTVYGSLADQLNFLSVEYLEGDAVLNVLIEPQNISPGMVLSSGLNVWYVIGVDPAQKQIAVYASYDNSPNGALPQGSPIMIRPRATDWMLFGFLNDAIVSMSSPSNGLYRQSYWEDPNTDVVWGTYDIPTEAQNMTSLIRVQARDIMTPDLWFDIPDPYVEWQPENQIVRIKGSVPMGTPLRFDYRAPFKAAISLTDDLEVDLGLAPSMFDIPALGAASTLMLTTETRRVQIHNQGDSRRAEEVGAGSNGSAARELGRQFKQRVAEEQIRLVARNPYVRSIP